MNIYYTGKILNPVPTGLGGYTGLVLTNSGNFPVSYTATIGDTVLYKNGDTVVVPSSDKTSNANSQTIFITDDLRNNNINDSSYEFTVNPSESGFIYVLHRPFTSFSAGNSSTGYEVARLTVNSNSSVGDSDLPIYIDISGQRVFDNPVPSRIGKFYAVKQYLKDQAYTLEFFWNTLTPTNYFKRFIIDLSSYSNFNPVLYSYTGDIDLENDSNKPLFGDYNAFMDKSFSVKFTNLDVGQDYYARIKGLNFDDEPSDYSYPTGYNYYSPILTPVGVSGLYPSPGDNLRSDSSILYLTRSDDFESNFNIYDFIKQKNNNSDDFRFYSGVNIKFNPSKETMAKYIATTTSSGGMNFIIPSTDNFRYSSNASNIFTIEIELNNISILGRGGEGVKFKEDGSFIDAQNGGPALKFDDYTYQNKKIEYRIYKDISSKIYGGAGGGLGWTTTDTTTSDSNTNLQQGSQINTLDGYDLNQYIP